MAANPLYETALLSGLPRQPVVGVATPSDVSKKVDQAYYMFILGIPQPVWLQEEVKGSRHDIV